MYREIIKMTASKYGEANHIEKDILNKAEEDNENDDLKKGLLQNDYDPAMQTISTTNVAGVVDQADVNRLQKLIFRATRGKAMCITEDVDPELLKEEGIQSAKSMYLIIFQSGEFLNQKVKTICDSFMGQTFELPEIDDCTSRINDLSSKIHDSKEVLARTKREIKNYYVMVNNIKESSSDSFKVYEMYIKKEIRIYETMNKLVPENKLLHGFFWSDIDKNEMSDKM